MAFERGMTVWHNHFGTPRVCEFVELFCTANSGPEKAVVLVRSEPSVVEAADLYSDRRECYRAAAILKQREAAKALGTAADYLEKVDEKEHD